jgi:hypothetical protein
MSQSWSLTAFASRFGILDSSHMLLTPPKMTDFHFPELVEQEREIRERLSRTKDYSLGDFYATRHSNLPGVEVVLHLATSNDELEADSFSARSAVMGGIRNIIRHAFESGISQLSIPLLLVNRFVPEVRVHFALLH